MPKRRNRQFWESAVKNTGSFAQYYNRLTELAISMFEWKNMPPTIDTRFLELTLFKSGMAAFFEDPVIGHLALTTVIDGPLNVYNIPVRRRAFATNGYQKSLDESDSVLIFNNLLHQPSFEQVQTFASRLWDLDRIIEVNAKAQKTPVLLSCEETQRLTLMNLYKKYDGNEPFIFGDKNLSPNALKVITTGAPYVADKLYMLKTQIWNEALTFLGISNLNTTKKERLITDEVARNQGGTVMSRYSRLVSRQNACKQINEMFGLNVWCDYRKDFDLAELNEPGEGGSEDE